MDQSNTPSTLTLSTPVLDALIRLKAVTERRQRPTSAQKRVALARARAERAARKESR